MFPESRVDLFYPTHSPGRVPRPRCPRSPTREPPTQVQGVRGQKETVQTDTAGEDPVVFVYKVDGYTETLHVRESASVTGPRLGRPGGPGCGTRRRARAEGRGTVVYSCLVWERGVVPTGVESAEETVVDERRVRTPTTVEERGGGKVCKDWSLGSVRDLQTVGEGGSRPRRDPPVEVPTGGGHKG